jgi:hypothetical protein
MMGVGGQRRACAVPTIVASWWARFALPTLQKHNAYFGYLNSGAAFSASLVVLIDASHLLFLLS